MRRALCLATLLSLWPGVAHALDRPWIADTYFYWYTWDYKLEQGGWMGGVWNTPLCGYYDSSLYKDNLRELRTASEWGITDHFMDYWGQGWKGEGDVPREAVVMRAAEELARRGYDIHMSFYQDGTDFDMKDFARNLDEGRDFRFYVENWGQSPVLPKVDLRPVYLVYGRNGAPAVTKGDEGFRAWVRERYPGLYQVGKAWGRELASWDDVKLDFGTGVQRADSILYQRHVWATQWGELERRAQDEFHLSGVKCSFDVAWKPYQGWDYSTMPKVLCGPHSYAGIFGAPEQDETDRFIQNVVAKYYNTVFFDTFKNYYHDAEIRTPGTIYPSEPLHFDRFWAGNLGRYAEAMLHLSWNEWWEGSNLEPSLEYGKTYCEKNLLWATVMRQCFDSIRQWHQGARVAVLLNDWHWLVGGRNQQDITGCIETLRRANIRFDLIPDDFVTREKLGSFEVVIAPTGGTGLGRNAAGDSIADILREWVEQQPAGPGARPRRLIASQMPEWHEWLGLQAAEARRGEAKAGPDLNLWVDVGVEGGDRYLVEGSTQREDWGKLPPESFGATDHTLTCRWTPGAGDTTVFLLPFSPHRDHVLRLAGSAFRANRVHVLLDGQEAAVFDLQEGYHEYEVRLPAAVVGAARLGELVLRYERRNVPMELDPEHFPQEGRVCNLAIDWLQLSTDNIPAHNQAPLNADLPEETARFTGEAPGELRGAAWRVGWTRHEALAAPAATVMSRYASDEMPRDLVVRRGENAVWYVNGLVGAEAGKQIAPLVTAWAGVEPEYRVEGTDVTGTMLAAADTRVVLAYHDDSSRRAGVELRVPLPGGDLSEFMALSRDGKTFVDLTDRAQVAGGYASLREELQYYGAYAVASGPVTLRTPPLALVPGEAKSFTVLLDNNVNHVTTARLSLVSAVPTIRGDEVEVHLDPYEDEQAAITLRCDDTVDWGHKTVVFDLACSGRHVYLWRQLDILRPPEPRLTHTLVDAARAEWEVENPASPLMPGGVAEDVRLAVGERQAELGDVACGSRSRAGVPVPVLPGGPRLESRLAELSWRTARRRQSATTPVYYAVYPQEYEHVPDAVGPVAVFNAQPEDAINEVVSVSPEPFRKAAKVELRRLFVRAADQRVVPSQLSADGTELLFLATVPARSAATYYVCAGPAPGETAQTLLTLASDGLGTGHGWVAVNNDAVEVRLEEQAGGCVTALRSKPTGLDYAPRSFGVAYGNWGRFEPSDAAVTTTTYLGSKLERVEQASAPGVLEVLEAGPVRARVRATWHDAAVAAQQVYTFVANRAGFSLDVVAEPHGALDRYDELVPLNVRLERNRLTKVFPDFVGIAEGLDQEQENHGWRQASYVPPYATCMTPWDFPESISVVLRSSEGLDRFRNGLWPAERPGKGPARYVWLEYISQAKRPCRLSADVLVHPGHQKVARVHLERLKDPLLAIVPDNYRWAGQE